MKIYTHRSITLLVSAAMLLAACSHEEKQHTITADIPVKVTVATAGKKEGGGIRSSGQIEAAETALISTRVMGYIAAIYVTPGDHVAAGQLLVAINNADILAKRAQAQAMVDEAEAALKDARKDHDRYVELYRQQSASAKEVENMALHLQSIQAKTEAARQMQREAEAMLAYTQIKAPFAGVIVQRNQDTGSMANPGAPILVLEQAGKYQVTTSVAEEDIDRIREGMSASVTIKSSGHTIIGKVSEVSPSSHMNGGRYRIKISLPESDNIYSGMYVQVSIVDATAKVHAGETVLIPSSALVHKDQLAGIYTVSEHTTALLRWVRPGRVYGEQVEILSGLRADEAYILSAEGRLYNGVPLVVK